MPHAEVNRQWIHFEETGGDGPAATSPHGFLMGLTNPDPIDAAIPAFLDGLPA